VISVASDYHFNREANVQSRSASVAVLVIVVAAIIGGIAVLRSSRSEAGPFGTVKIVGVTTHINIADWQDAVFLENGDRYVWGYGKRKDGTNGGGWVKSGNFYDEIVIPNDEE